MDTKTTALTQKPAPAPTTDIDIELIAVVSPSRRPIDQAAVKRLAESIARQGLVTPIDVVRIETGIHRGRYKLIAGAHRLEANLAVRRSRRGFSLGMMLWLGRRQRIFSRAA